MRAALHVAKEIFAHRHTCVGNDAEAAYYRVAVDVLYNFQSVAIGCFLATYGVDCNRVQHKHRWRELCVSHHRYGRFKGVDAIGQLDALVCTVLEREGQLGCISGKVAVVGDGYSLKEYAAVVGLDYVERAYKGGVGNAVTRYDHFQPLDEQVVRLLEFEYYSIRHLCKRGNATGGHGEYAVADDALDREDPLVPCYTCEVVSRSIAEQDLKIFGIAHTRYKAVHDIPTEICAALQRAFRELEVMTDTGNLCRFFGNLKA